MEDRNNLKSITIKVSENFYKDLKIYMIEKGCTLKDYFIELVSDDMKKNKTK